MGSSRVIVDAYQYEETQDCTTKISKMGEEISSKCYSFISPSSRHYEILAVKLQ